MKSLAEGHRANQCGVRIQTQAWLTPEPSSFQAPTLSSVAPGPPTVRPEGLSPQGSPSPPPGRAKEISTGRNDLPKLIPQPVAEPRPEADLHTSRPDSTTRSPTCPSLGIAGS